MNWKLQSTVAVLIFTSICGCQSIQKNADLENEMVSQRPEARSKVVQAGCYDDPYNRYGSGSACSNSDNANCGLGGVVCEVAKESWALLGVLTSARWEGGYPNGVFGGWRGSWCGPCGEGSLDTTVPTCTPPGASSDGYTETYTETYSEPY